MPTNHLPSRGPPCCQTTAQSFQHDLLAVPLRNSSLKEHDVPVESAASCCWSSCCFQHWPPHRCNTTTLVFWMKEIPFDLPFSWKCVLKKWSNLWHPNKLAPWTNYVWRTLGLPKCFFKWLKKKSIESVVVLLFITPSNKRLKCVETSPCQTSADSRVWIPTNSYP